MSTLILSRRSMLIHSTAALVASLTTWISAQGADTPETAEIKSRLSRQFERIQSLDVSFKLDTTTPLKPEQLLALPEFRNQLFLPIDEWRVAFKGTKRYSRQIQPERMTLLKPLGEYGLAPPLPVDPKASEFVRKSQKAMIEQYDRAIANMKAQEARGERIPRRNPNVRPIMERDVTRAFNGHTLWMRRPQTEKLMEYQVWSSASEANWFQPTAYQNAAGLFVTDPTGMPLLRKVQAIFQVAEWVKQHPYEIEAKTDVVDGSTCIVLKGNLNQAFPAEISSGNLIDRIWLDRDHGLALRRREFFRDGQLQMRWENSQLKEVEPGIWLPTHSRHDTFAAEPPAEWKGKPVMTEEIRVEKIEINRVSDELFDMNPQKGDHIDDLREGI